MARPLRAKISSNVVVLPGWEGVLPRGPLIVLSVREYQGQLDQLTARIRALEAEVERLTQQIREEV